MQVLLVKFLEGLDINNFLLSQKTQTKIIKVAYDSPGKALAKKPIVVDTIVPIRVGEQSPSS